MEIADFSSNESVSATSPILLNPAKGFLFALGSIMLSSTNFISGKYVMSAFNSTSFSVIWTTGATFFTFILIVLTMGWRAFIIPRVFVPKIVIMGILSGTSMLLGWAGLTYLDPSFSAFLWRSVPIMMLFLSFVFLGEKFSLIEIFPVTIMILGGFVSAVGRWEIIGMGVILTLSSCSAVSLQLLLAKKMVNEIDPRVVAFYRVLIATFIHIIYVAFTRDVAFDVPISYWLVAILGSLIGPCLSLIAMFEAYKYWELSRVSLIQTMEPVFVLTLAWFILNRLPTIQALWGGGMILGGALWMVVIHYRRNAR